jgi:hypothetical protein
MSTYGFSRGGRQAERAVWARKRRTFARRCVHDGDWRAKVVLAKSNSTGGEPAGGLAASYRGSKPMADRALSNVLAAMSPARLAPSAKIDWTDPGS